MCVSQARHITAGCSSFNVVKFMMGVAGTLLGRHASSGITSCCGDVYLSAGLAVPLAT